MRESSECAAGMSAGADGSGGYGASGPPSWEVAALEVSAASAGK